MKYAKYFLYLLVLLALIFFGKGLLSPTVTYTCETTADKSIQESWAVMSDDAKMADWLEGFLRAEHVSGTPNTVGAVSRIYFDNKGQEMMIEETIVSIVPEESIAMSFTMDFMDMDYVMYLEEQDGKTKIRSETSATGNGMLAKSMVSFMPKAMKAQEDKNLENLKGAIEANTKDYFPAEDQGVLVE